MQRFYSCGRERRKSSIDKVLQELEDFKIEIQRRFAKSKFSQTYKFPRVETKHKRAKGGACVKNLKNTKSHNQLPLYKTYQSLTNKDSIIWTYGKTHKNQVCFQF